MKYVFVLFCMFICISCTVQTPVYLKDAKAYGVTSGLFNDGWWSFYERGLSFAEGEFYGEALEDLQTAIQMRSNDQWKSRTYGMHFIDYFPHREQGIVYYRTGKYDDAAQELETSLKTAESARAKFFLNMTRKATWSAPLLTSSRL